MGLTWIHNANTTLDLKFNTRKTPVYFVCNELYGLENAHIISFRYPAFYCFGN